MIALTGVWHTGTHTAKRILGDAVSVYAHCDRSHELEGWPLVLTMRHPIAVYRSWRRRHGPVGDLFLSMWRTLFELKEGVADSFWLPVDTADRDARLSMIERRLGVDLIHDWSPQNVFFESPCPPILNWRAWRNPKAFEGLAEAEACKAFRSMPFDEFGYEL